MGSAWLHQVVHWMQVIQGAGWVGWLLFIGLYAASCLLFIPGSILTLAAGAVYGFWEGTLLVLIGNGLGALLSLLITRYLLRDWAHKQFARHTGLRAMETAVRKDGWTIVCLTRLSPVMPFSLINYSLGLTKLPVLKFLFTTEVGAIPSTCIYVYFGTLVGSLTRLGPDLHQQPRAGMDFPGLWPRPDHPRDDLRDPDRVARVEETNAVAEELDGYRTIVWPNITISSPAGTSTI